MNLANLFQMSVHEYTEMLQKYFLYPVDIGEGLQVPNYFQIMFKIIDTGNKGYINEQDLFTMMQDFDRKRDKHLKM
jgi:hypothetical protein